MLVRLLAALLLGSGCSEQSGSANTTPTPEVGVELTEPWKSIGFSLGGATVLRSADTTLAVAFPLAERAETETIHRMLVQSLKDDGWSMEDDDQINPTDFSASYRQDGQRILLDTSVRDGRVEAFIRMRDIKP